jgi:hypothetical protein
MLKNTETALALGRYRVSLCGETSEPRVAVHVASRPSPVCPTN